MEDKIIKVYRYGLMFVGKTSAYVLSRPDYQAITISLFFRLKFDLRKIKSLESLILSAKNETIQLENKSKCKIFIINSLYRRV